MATSTYVSQEPLAPSGASRHPDRDRSGVSWAAIFAGALAAGVLSFLLFILGVGLGLSSVSVWSGHGAGGDTMGWTAVAWFTFTQLASAGVGGYIAGRLRTRWQGVHTDEVYFRDTAHGFLSWSLATLLMLALMGSVAGSAITGTVKAAGAVVSGAGSVVGGAVSAVGGAVGTVGGAAASAAGGAASANAQGTGGASSSGLGYWMNSLFRNGGLTDSQKADANQAAQKARSAADVTQEVTGIFVQSLQDGKLSDDDANYVAQLISSRTDISTADAKQRVQKTFEQAQQKVEEAKQKAQEAVDTAKQAAETARKAVAYSMLWLFVALLVGAFVASLSATWGGRQRDAF